MKLKKGAVTILFDEYGMTIEVHDRTAILTLCRVSLNPEQTVKALARLGYCDADVEVFNLERVNHRHEHKKFEFLMPAEHIYDLDEEKEIAQQEALRLCPEGWEPDMTFNSRDSFFHKRVLKGSDKSKYWARTIIRRWVPLRTIKRR